MKRGIVAVLTFLVFLSFVGAVDSTSRVDIYTAGEKAGFIGRLSMSDVILSWIGIILLVLMVLLVVRRLIYLVFPKKVKSSEVKKVLSKKKRSKKRKTSK